MQLTKYTYKYGEASCKSCVANTRLLKLMISHDHIYACYAVFHVYGFSWVAKKQ